MFDDLRRIWSGFFELLISRAVNAVSGTASGIAPTEVAAWLELRQIADPEQRALFAEAIAAMDAVWLEQARAAAASKPTRAK
ncbi:MAG: hypothetical protein IT454_09390 [Planctomycetes bacterium]|nr:hypothetical protein [Planctomycetota bacterium]